MPSILKSIYQLIIIYINKNSFKFVISSNNFVAPLTSRSNIIIEDSFDESQTKLLTKINSSINLSRLFFAISFIFMILNLGIIYVYISGGIINAIGKLKDLMQGILSGNDDQEQNKEEEREDEIGEINKAVVSLRIMHTSLKILMMN